MRWNKSVNDDQFDVFYQIVTRNFQWPLWKLSVLPDILILKDLNNFYMQCLRLSTSLHCFGCISWIYLKTVPSSQKLGKGRFWFKPHFNKRIFSGKVRLGSQLTLNPLQVKIEKCIVIWLSVSVTLDVDVFWKLGLMCSGLLFLCSIEWIFTNS